MKKAKTKGKWTKEDWTCTCNAASSNTCHFTLFCPIWLHFRTSHNIINWCHNVISSWDFQLDNAQKPFPPKCFIPSLFYILATYPAHRNLLHFTVLTTPDFMLRSHRKTGFRSDQHSQFDELTSNSIISLKSIRISIDNIHTSHDICLYPYLISILSLPTHLAAP